MGRENVKNIQKTNESCCFLGGKFKTLGGEISPPKGPEKNTADSESHSSMTRITNTVF